MGKRLIIKFNNNSDLVTPQLTQVTSRNIGIDLTTTTGIVDLGGAVISVTGSEQGTSATPMRFLNGGDFIAESSPDKIIIIADLSDNESGIIMDVFTIVASLEVAGAISPPSTDTIFHIYDTVSTSSSNSELGESIWRWGSDGTNSLDS